MLRRFALTVSLALLVTPSVLAAQAAAPSAVEQLEQRVQALQAEIARLKAAPATDERPPAAPSDAVARLAEELQALDQRVRVFQRNLELEREQATKRAATQPRVTAGREGFSLQSSDNAFRIRFRGYVHSDGRFYAGDSGLTTPSTFVLRRVRPIIEATMFRNFDFRIMPDFGGGTTVVQDAYIDARIRPYLRIRAGKFKSPFGLERLASALDLTFVERGMPTLLAPNRDLGVMVHGDVLETRLAYQAALTNGVIDGGSADVDDRTGKDLVGRIFVEPFKAQKTGLFKGLGVGVAGSLGEEKGSRTVPGLATFRTAGQQAFFRYRGDATAAGTVFADGDRARGSLQGYWYRGAVGLLVERSATRQDLRLGNVRQTITNTASLVSGSFFLTGENASFTSMQPLRDLDAARGRWGAIELTGRLTQFVADRDAFPLLADPAASARQATEWALGTNWYLNRAVKVSVGFHETRFDGGAAGGDRRTERDVLTRMQLAF
jgi:phosphate-selective porin OprO and OprP